MNGVYDSSEIDKILPFCEDFIKNKSLMACVLYGKKGAEKRKLINQIFERIFSDQSLLAYAPKLSKKDIFYTAYSQSDKENIVPYKSFIEITKIIEKRKKLLSILNRILGVLIAFTGYGDLLDKFKELADEVKTLGDKEEKIRDKEKKLFKQFEKEIKKYSKKKPFIITIGNAQWMDKNSLQLFKHILEEASNFWGLIILDYTIDESEPTQHDVILWKLVKENLVHVIKAKLIGPQYMNSYQIERFGTKLFSHDEIDRIIEICQGVPSKLEELLENWIRQKLIFKENGNWIKSKHLNIKELLTTEERLIEVCKVFMKDGKLTGIEEEAFYTQAKSQGLTDEQVEEIQTLALFEVKNPKYHIIRKVRVGAIGDIYKAYDLDRKHYVFIEIDRGLKNSHLGKEDLDIIRSSSFLNTLEISKAENFNFTVTEYTRGITLSDLKPEFKFFNFNKVYKITKNLLSAISLLHRKNFIHGNIRPENIFVEEDGSVRVGSVGFIKSLRDDVAKGITSMQKSPYSSPEHVKGERLTLQSDVFSLGVIIYELFTGQLPFQGENEQQINDAILHGPIKESVYLNNHPDIKTIITKALDKNDQVRQSSAESLNIAFDHVKLPYLKQADVIKSVGESKSTTKILKKLKWVFIPLIVVIMIFWGAKIWKTLFPTQYSDVVAIDRFDYKSEEIERGIIEYLLLRSLNATSNKYNFILDDSSNNIQKGKNPQILLKGEVEPSYTGYMISVNIHNRGKKAEKNFQCKGYFDLLSEKIDEIHTFICSNSDGIVEQFSNNMKFSTIFTDNWDACNRFLKGENAWNKIETDDAHSHFSAALEYDPKFVLARLKLIEVLAWQGYNAEARDEIERAFKNRERLIRFDLLRLKALEAKINSNPGEQRKFLRQLVESFPGKKEYHYEFAESYFHCGEAEEAINHYLQALKLDNTYALAHNHIGFCYSWIGNHELAINHFKKYVELDKTANSYDSLASGYMFAGRYEEGINTCKEGLNIKNLYYLYGNMASNLVSKGRLNNAIECLNKEITLAERETTRIDDEFDMAWIEYLKGNFNGAENKLNNVLMYYSSPMFIDELDDSSNLPYWFKGILAFRNNDLETLSYYLGILEDKIDRFNVSETNYFPIFKFYLHLKVLYGYLTNDDQAVKDYISIAKRVKHKLGYWSSIYNLSYFFTEYADILIKQGNADEAQELLLEALNYNSSNPSTYILLAKLYLKDEDEGKATEFITKAKDLLSEADEDYIFIRALENNEN